MLVIIIIAKRTAVEEVMDRLTWIWMMDADIDDEEDAIYDLVMIVLVIWMMHFLHRTFDFMEKTAAEGCG